MTEAGYIQQLRDKLIQRLADDWETNWKDKGHGHEFIHFGLVKNKNSLYNELRADVYRAIEARYGTNDARARFVSPDSIRRLLDERHQGGFAEKVKDAISIYLGYDSWEDFKNKHELEPPSPDDSPIAETSISNMSTPTPVRQPASGLPAWQIRTALSLLLVLLIGATEWAIYSRQRIQGAPVRFEIANVYGTGAPVTVEILYNISGRSYQRAEVQVTAKNGKILDLFPLQESAGKLLISLLHSGVRCFHLVVDGKMVRSLTYIVKTNGWIGRIVDHGQSYPIIKGSQLLQNGSLYIEPPAILKQDTNALYFLFFSNCRDFGIRGNAAVLEFRARNCDADGGLICHDITAHLEDAESGEVAVRFIAPSCIGYASMSLNNQLFNARNDPPLAVALGQDTERWATYRLAIADDRIRAYRNGKFLFERPCPGPIDTLKQLMFEFKGGGRIDWLRLTDAKTGRVAYQEDF